MIANKKGKQILDLSIGNPDLPPPDFVSELFIKQMYNQGIYCYPQIYGEKSFKEIISYWAYKKYGVKVDPEYEVLPLLGVKEGITHLALGTLNPGDVGAYITPSYPIYKQAIELAKGTIIKIDTIEERRYLPELDNLDNEDLRKIKLLYINYPNNPTGTVIDKSFCKSLINLALKNNFYVCLDCVYSNITPFSSYKHFSILSLPDADKCCIEMYSFSKSFNLPGIRLGYAIGNKRLINNLKSIKTVVDVSAFKPLQHLGSEILKKDIHGELDQFYCYNNSVYAKRIAKFYELFRSQKIHYYDNNATYYVWFKIPEGLDEQRFCENLFEDEGILIIPGSELNSQEKGWCRIAVSRPDDVINESINKLNLYFQKLER
jgi:LL-diaminopimelate aminotransferase